MSLVLSTSGKLRTQAQCLWRKRLQKLTDSSWAGDKHTPHLLPGAISSVPSPDSLPQRHNFSCQATLIHHRPWCLVTLRAPFSHFCVLLPASNTFQGIRVFFWWPEGLNSTSCISEDSENKEQRPITIACPGNMEMLAPRCPLLGARRGFGLAPTPSLDHSCLLSFQITQKRYSKWLENLTQHNPWSFVRGLGLDQWSSWLHIPPTSHPKCEGLTQIHILSARMSRSQAYHFSQHRLLQQKGRNGSRGIKRRKKGTS